ncbi:L-threonylcarbamoyladenylate synthase [Pelagibacterium halotolerans]|uniref:Threonylcarbamoyl-AMP synthase n=1 Tax=Pelagibacterium halotolerans (strain DSM 22347 / JCM 15775 / CGMCC 1.7692 / B2) TaxID=1082931 RepID=G4RBX2_PELHB|nr:L-threonylcarbamoyladenylate synthase [Pelagibacterium halotolerans]AEQ50635.1 YrdC/Sua5 family protein, required for threonylcarbamoyladenosine (t(6)A) formation in tRNA [Pelagibacterium halotolerans B2]QJR19428.1 threonylcarbamoyl-AMP synthase [Pelagibacterium halotolerans]SDZ91649.1 translation factor SUA5 [Pelagibacterium halotolerans]
MKPAPADPQSVADAAALLQRGQLCAFATETVYGLGADATNSDAVLKIYETKGRPRFNPLISHCADMEMAERFGEFSPLARSLADAFWPGPLTLVVPLKPGAGLSDLVTAGLDTVGLRVPAHPMARELIAALGRPVAAPSANPSGRLSPTIADHVRTAFSGAVPVLEGGPCQNGLESTIIAVTGDTVTQLRAGALAREDIEAFLGHPIALAAPNAAITAPGMLKSHYAPNAALRLDAEEPASGEAYLAFGPAPAHDGPFLNLSESGDLREAARNLFSHLARLDASGANSIAVAPIPDTGLGEAINDRLERAAAPRNR